jgi:hypothetical protein
MRQNSFFLPPDFILESYFLELMSLVFVAVAAPNVLNNIAQLHLRYPCKGKEWNGIERNER